MRTKLVGFRVPVRQEKPVSVCVYRSHTSVTLSLQIQTSEKVQSWSHNVPLTSSRHGLGTGLEYNARESPTSKHKLSKVYDDASSL